MLDIIVAKKDVKSSYKLMAAETVKLSSFFLTLAATYSQRSSAKYNTDRKTFAM